jgi:tetratricopeptide (TPR) repeat protein
VALAEEAGPNLVRAGHQVWFSRLDVERGNFRRAMAWAIKRGETILALRYTVALWRYWRQLGEFVEGRRWSDASVGMPGEAPPSLRAKALGAAAALAWPQGDYDRMAELAAAAIDLAQRSEDPMDLRDALTVEGMVAMGRGRYAEAVERFRECLAICGPLGLSWQLATSHLNLGTAQVLSGSPEAAEATLEEGLEMYRQLGDDIFAARMTHGIAYAARPATRLSEPTAWLASLSPPSRNRQSARGWRRVWRAWRLSRRHAETRSAPPLWEVRP